MTQPPVITTEIGLLLYPDVQLAAVYGLTDLFRIAGEQSLLREDGQHREIRVSHWQLDNERQEVICVHDSHPGSPNNPRHLIAPPSLIMPDRMKPMDGFATWLKDRHAAGATLCSVCAGAFVLGETGLLEGRTATTHWAFAEALARRFPTIDVDVNRMVIDDGDIITAGGILAWTDLGLTLVERFLGPSVMLDTARFLLIDPPGRSQQPYNHFVPKLDHGDTAVLKVQHWLHATGAKDHSIAAMAREAKLEERTLLRRFQKATGLRPTEYAQHIRIAKAREALELSQRPIEQIAWQVGYSDPAAFRKLFQRITGLAPADYRRRFGLAA